MPTTLIVPGLYSSGSDHWQTWFEQRIPGTVRVIQSDWSKPDLPEWSRRIRRAIARTPGRIFLVAHSFGVLAGVHAATDFSGRVAGAFLVAPADPDKFGLADYLPQHALPFTTVVVASTNDPWMSLPRAAAWADRWDADLVNLGEAGHINAEAGFGPWPEGLAIFDRLRRRAGADRVGNGEHRAASSLQHLPAAWRQSSRRFGGAGRVRVRRLVGVG